MSKNVNVQRVIGKNPLTEELHDYRINRIKCEIPILENSPHNEFLALWKYIENIPEKFLHHKSYNDIYLFLEELKNDDNSILILILQNFEKIASIAFETLNDINKLEFHDFKITNDEYELMIFLDMKIHPSYMRLIESVYSELIYPLSSYYRIKRSVKLEGFDVYKRVEELEKSGKYNYLARPYNHTIRNAIAHGGVVYKPPSTTVYEDKNNRLELFSKEVISNFDDMLDICNGLALGYRLFYTMNRDFMEKHNVKTPLSLVTDELRAELYVPGWSIKKCFESETYDNKSQLIIFTQNDIFNSAKILYFAFRSAILIEKNAPGYERYFFNYESKKSLKGWSIFNGIELEKLRKQEANKIDDYKNSLENHFVFSPKYIVKIANLFSKLSTLILSFKIQYNIEKEKLGRKLNPLAIEVRETTIHRNGNFSVINGSVVVKSNQNIQMDILIKNNHKLILRKIIKNAKKETKITAIERYLPVGHVKITVFEHDFRMSLFQNLSPIFFQHNKKHAISNNPLKTIFSLSYLLAIFLNPIFNHAKNRSIVPLL